MTRDRDSAARACVPPISDVLDIAVRTYGVPEGRKDGEWEFSTRGPSHWQLIFDTETTTDETQCLRIGAYQLRYDAELREHGLFYDPAMLTEGEKSILERYAAAKRLKVIPLREFVDGVFVRVAYHWQATTIGFNLPFDVSQLATDQGEARGKMRPGFSFGTAEKGLKGPRVRIKHLSRRASLIEFSGAGQRLPRGQRKRRVKTSPRRPAFLDVSTLAAALLSRTFSLGELAKHLNTPSQKLGTEEHGRALTIEYLDYAVQDVQVTWECFVELQRRYAEHRLDSTPIHRILSEASIGKGYLREMSFHPWRKMQQEFPPELIGKIMATYFGGRTEVHQRRVVMQVLYCDFTSMYPTVSTLMGLWPYVIAKGMTWHDATAETRKFLDRVTLVDLQRPETWRRLHAVVKVEPDGDILPVRAKYEYEPFSDDDKRGKHYTIGLNHLTSDQPLWYSLADCVASKLLSGHAPKIIEAVAFRPSAPQDGLKPVAIAGNPDFRVDPLKEDFFKRIIELRMQTQGPERNQLKLVANATGYGIFVQLDVNERSEPITIRCYPATGRQFLVDMDKVEEPGEFFHPLIGTLITSAARLMLAISERLVEDSGLTWAFCDTDSMAIARPLGMSEVKFIGKAQAVRNWFKFLNPYSVPVDLFKLEDANYRLVNGNLTKKFAPLHCFAISSKRYVLFNIDRKGQPVIRKATAHGLGHLLPPYRDENAPPELPRPAFPAVQLVREVGVNRWQHDLWHCIARVALAGDPDRPDFSNLMNFDRPAVNRYSVTTARLWDWFDRYNRDRPESGQIRPFNFMLMYQPDQMADWDRWRSEDGIESSRAELPCIISSYDNDLAKAAKRCFDRDTGKPVPARMLKTYRQALAQYHLRPEAKFLNANYRESGPLQRRHVKVSGIAYIGKEANRWEEQSYLGIDPEMEIAYGMAPEDRGPVMAEIKQAAGLHGPVAMAKAAGVSRQHLNAIVSGAAAPTDRMLRQLVRGATRLSKSEVGETENAHAMLRQIRAMVRAKGLRGFAQEAGIDPGNLTRILQGKRKLGRTVLARVRVVCAVHEAATKSRKNDGYDFAKEPL